MAAVGSLAAVAKVLQSRRFSSRKDEDLQFVKGYRVMDMRYETVGKAGSSKSIETSALHRRRGSLRRKKIGHESRITRVASREPYSKVNK